MNEIVDIKKYRETHHITLEEASSTCQIPKRTYIRYENDNNYGSIIKREFIIRSLLDTYEITEEKGILRIDEIKEKVKEVLDEYILKHENTKIDFCFLFGSYAKGYAKEDSDIDICISSNLKGLNFVEVIELLREKLSKKIDLIRLDDLDNNQELLKEIMKDGFKIYG